MRDKTFNIATNLEFDGYQSRLALKLYKFFDKETPIKTSGGGIENEIFKKKLADLADMRLISKVNK